MRYSTTFDLFNTAAYVRLSREDGDKEESDSIGNQKKLLTEYIEGHDDLVLRDFYIDDGYSGTNFERPGFRRMITDIEAGKINCVVVKDLSRFGRDYIDSGRYLERIFPELNVRFVAITDSIDSFKQSYDMLLPIKNIFNEQYARDISKKIQTAVGTKQRSGEFIGAFPSYGYKKSPKNKNQLIVDEYAAEVVRRIFALFIQGYGKQEIAKQLNREGILCPAEYKKANGQNYCNAKRLPGTKYWSYTTIASMLQREIYIGNMVQGTKHQQMRGKQKAVARENWIVVKGTHEAIIDMDTWEKTQLLLKKRTRKMDFRPSENVFSGFLKCGDCGRAMTKHVWHLSDGSRRYHFHCGTYQRNGKEYCTPHSISLELLEKIVLKDLKEIIQSMDDLQEIVCQQQQSAVKKNLFVDKEMARLADELAKIQRLKQSIYEDYKEGLISKEEFLSYRKEYLGKEQKYAEQMHVWKEKKENQKEEDLFFNPWMKRLLEFRAIEKLDRSMVAEMIHEIRIYEEHKVVIQYNFSDELDHLFSRVYIDKN